MQNDDQRFGWTKFYEAVADRLVEYKDKDQRAKLVNFHGRSLTVRTPDDICPFTVMAMFNRRMRDSRRSRVAKDLASLLGIDETAPESFEGIPILNAQNYWFFAHEKKRDPGDIDSLWNFFKCALDFADGDGSDARGFSEAYERVAKQKTVGLKKITTGLYWIRPWKFLSVSGSSRTYASHELGIEISDEVENSAKDYLALLHEIELRFKEEDFPVRSFPELSFAARSGAVPFRPKGGDIEVSRRLRGRYIKPTKTENPRRAGTPGAKSYDLLLEHGVMKVEDYLAKGGRVQDLNWDVGHESAVLSGGPTFDGTQIESEAVPVSPAEPYRLKDIVSDGCFLPRKDLEDILEQLRTKKNVILQGPPGTGKTWLAKKLAFALMGKKDEGRLHAVQFHPTLSYEDFIRGWRPSGDGKLTLVDGPFQEMIEKAKKDREAKHVIVIEEINRGNPAQIFGEMLTLMEAGKRSPGGGLALSYPRYEGERVYVPENLYVIGTMNIADRSLALVDLALRRRFAFIDMEPIFERRWKVWVHKESGVALEFLEKVKNRMLDLNEKIGNDLNLGAQFRVGHSYVTPSGRVEDEVGWYRGVVKTGIGPLLEEYWFDNPEEARKAKKALLEGI